MKYLFFVLVICVNISCTKSPERSNESELLVSSAESRIDQYAEAMMDSFDIRGAVAVGVVQHGETIVEKAYGYADAEKKLKANSSTPFYIASITKSFVGTMCAILDEKGLIDLEESLATAIPFSLPNEIDLEDVQFRDLLTHTSGISNYSVPFKTAYSGGFTREEILADFRESSYPTTKGFQYSNLGYIIAGLILEDRLNENWKDLLKVHLLDPIGMDHTSAYVSAYHPDSLAKPHIFNLNKSSRIELAKTGMKTVAFPKEDDTMHAAGGLITTIEDMNSWMKFHLTGFPEILSEEKVDSLHTDLVGMYESHGPFNSYGYGIGWFQSDWGEYQISSHSGGYSGYVAICALHRESGLGVTIMINQLNPGIYPMMSFVLGQYIKRTDLESHLSRELSTNLNFWNRYKHKLDSVASIGTEEISYQRKLSNYTGGYSSEELGVVNVRDNNGQLYISLGNLRFSSKYLGDDTFFIVGESHLFTDKAIFHFSDENTRADQVTIEGIKFERILN